MRTMRFAIVILTAAAAWGQSNLATPVTVLPKADGSAVGTLSFRGLSGHTEALQAPVLSANVTLTLPPANVAGAAMNDGAGVLTFQSGPSLGGVRLATDISATAGGYVHFVPITYSPTAGHACYDEFGNPVSQPSPSGAAPSFGADDVVMWNSASPLQGYYGWPIVGGVNYYQLGTACTAPLTPPLGMPNGLNFDSYLYTFGYATSTKAFNAIEVFHGGGVTAQGLEAVGVYPPGTQLRTGFTVNPFDHYNTVDSSYRTSNSSGSYLGGYVWTGYADDNPGGASGTCTSIAVCDNPLIAGVGVGPGLISYNTTAGADGAGSEVVYDGTAWRAFALQARGVSFSGLQVTAGNFQVDSSGNVSIMGTYNANAADGATVPGGFNVLYNRAYNSIQTVGGFYAAGTSHNSSFTVGSVGVIDNNGWVVSGVNTGLSTNTDIIQAPYGGVTAKWLIATDSLFWTGEAAPALPCSHTGCPPGQAKIYLDSTTHKLRVSEDGAAFVDLLGGSSQWTTSGSSIYYNGGNVGIGTTNPINKLVVSNSGAGGFELNPSFTSGSATGAYLASYDRSVGAYRDIMIDQGATMTVFKAGGNVGIGNTSPGSLLTVGSGSGFTVNSSGDVAVSDTATNSIQTLGGITAAVGVSTVSTATTALQSPNGGVTAKWLIASDSVFWLQEAAPALPSAGQSKVYMDSTSHTLKVSQNGAAFVDLLGASSQWTTSGSSIYYNGGNVGIGNTSPGSLLTVGSGSGFTVNSSGDVAVSDTATNSIQTLGGITAAVGVSTVSTATTALQSPNGGVTAKWLIASDSVFWLQEAAPALPSAGQSKVYMDSTSHTLKVSQNGAAFVDLLGASSQWTTSGSSIYYNGGNVGIGNTSPGSLLTVGSGSNFTVDSSGNAVSAAAFNSTVTSTALGFKINSGTFGVNGNGMIQINSSLAGLNVLTSTAYDSIQTNGGFKASGNSSGTGSFTVGSTAVIDNSGNFIGPYVSVSGTNYDAIQAASGGIKAGLGVTVGQALYPFGQTCSGLNTPASGYGGFGYQSGSTYCYYNSGWHTVDLSTAGGSSWTLSGTTLYPNSTSDAVVIGETSNLSGAVLEANGNITALGLFNSTATGSSIAFQTSNSNFQIDGAGDISAAGQMRALGHWMGDGGASPSLSCTGPSCPSAVSPCSASSLGATVTDTRGCVVVTAANVAIVTVTFAHTYSSIPVCVVGSTTGNQYPLSVLSISTSALLIGSYTVLPVPTEVMYACWQ